MSTRRTEGCLAMDIIEVTPDPPPPAYLTIPFDIKSILPKRHLSVAELLRYEFPNPFRAPHHSSAVPAWSDLPLHSIDATHLLSCAVPQQETVRRLLLDLQQLVSAPQSFNRASVSSRKVLPHRLPIWVLSFWDCLFEAYNICLSWRRCID